MDERVECQDRNIRFVTLGGWRREEWGVWGAGCGAPGEGGFAYVEGCVLHGVECQKQDGAYGMFTASCRELGDDCQVWGVACGVWRIW